MKVKDLLVYFNTTGTDAGTDEKWLDGCMEAGGPEKVLCREGDHLDLADFMVQAAIPGLNTARRKNSAFSEKGWSELGCFTACVVVLGLTTMFVLFG